MPPLQPGFCAAAPDFGQALLCVAVPVSWAYFDKHLILQRPPEGNTPPGHPCHAMEGAPAIAGVTVHTIFVHAIVPCMANATVGPGFQVLATPTIVSGHAFETHSPDEYPRLHVNLQIFPGVSTETP